MGIFDGVLLCSDIDGTLVHNGEISAETRDAVEYFKSEGGLFTVATGRYHNHLLEAHNMSVNTFVISVNGSVICSEDGSKFIYNTKLNPELINQIYDFVGDKYNLETLWAADVDRLELNFGEKTNLPSNKLMFVPKNEADALRLQDDLREAFDGKINVSRSWPTGIEVIDKNCGKGICARLLKELTYAETLVCVGDYENDITMLQDADYGFAVANASPITKEAAKYHTRSDSKYAISEVIETMKKELTV